MSVKAELVVYPDSDFWTRIVLGLVSGSVLAFWLLPIKADGLLGSVARMAGFAGMLLALTSAAFLILRVTPRRPCLRMSSIGITDRSTFVSVGLVSWEEILRIEEYDHNGHTYLGITLRDIRSIRARVNPLARRALQANIQAGRPAVSIPLEFLPVSLYTVMEYAQEYGDSRLFGAEGQGRGID